MHASLVGVFYKIISKVLSNRIKKVFPSIIDYSQSFFLKDMRLLDSVLVANELEEYIRRQGKSKIIIKEDYEKAYDSLK